MIPMTLAEIATVVGGRLDAADPGTIVSGAVVADSRTAGPGDLFVALIGERTDGHEHASEAFGAGAVGVLAARPVGVPAVVVDDPLAALGRLARAVVDRLTEPTGLTVIGITGSSGKTSTKDLLGAVLSRRGATVVPRGSFNNELGVPLTALRCDAATRYLVAEMGARGIGHIADLCRIAPPRIGVVLNVGAAHVGVFGDREITARAKGELVEALPPAAPREPGTASGVAVLNADDPLVAAMAARTVARVVRFGHSPEADVRAVDVSLDSGARASFRLLTPAGEAPVRLALHGAHHVPNALAAAAVALQVWPDAGAVADALGAARPTSRWRMEVRERADGVVVVNDAYNANPDSVRAALEALAAMSPPRPGGRRWAVLGEMLELGPGSAEEHRRAGAHAARLGIVGVVAVGSGARPIADGAAAGGSGDVHAVADPAAAVELLRDVIRPGDVVLVKASRSVGLEQVAAELLDAFSHNGDVGSPAVGDPLQAAGTVGADGAPYG